MCETEYYMKLALELAEKGRGRTSPNPLVGAVIVKHGQVLGTGYHKCYGKAHAEVNAFLLAEEKGADVSGADMYVTLEPCAHYGNTPPCAEAIVKKGIKRVFIGLTDPNPLVSGRGIKILEDAGIQVITGVMEEECRKKNEIFLKYISSKQPYVVMKTSQSLDGKIAVENQDEGRQLIISCEKSLETVHKMRNSLSAIMVGVNTVIADNPSLTARIENGRNPIRIIVDSKLRIPLDAKALDLTGDARCIIATTKLAEKSNIDTIGEKGGEVIILPEKDGRVDLKALMTAVGEMGIDSVLLEGGGKLIYSALNERLVDKAVMFYAPEFLGNGKTAVYGGGFNDYMSVPKLINTSVSNVGSDFMIMGDVIYGEKR